MHRIISCAFVQWLELICYARKKIACSLHKRWICQNIAPPFAQLNVDAAANEYSKTEDEYDAEGKVISESVTYDTGTKNTIDYSYDSEGRLITK